MRSLFGGYIRALCLLQDISKASEQRAAEAQQEVDRAKKEAEETASAEAERMRKLLASSAQEKAELEAKVARAAGALKAADELRDAKWAFSSLHAVDRFCYGHAHMRLSSSVLPVQYPEGSQ